jgi:prolyl oligopeptidase
MMLLRPPRLIVASVLAVVGCRGARAPVEVGVAPSQESSLKNGPESAPEDGLRWMEDGGPRLEKWLADENAKSERVFARIPGLSRLQAELTEATTGEETVDDLENAGKSTIFLHRPAGERTSKLVTWDGKVRRSLFAPSQEAGGGSREIIKFVQAPDGKKVIVLTTEGGDERGRAELISTVSDRSSPTDVLEDVTLDSLHWLPDASGMLYQRIRHLTADAAAVELYRGITVYLHKLGEDQTQDVPVFGTASPSSPGLLEDDIPTIDVSGAYALGSINRQEGRPPLLFLKSTHDLLDPSVRWLPIADESEGVVDFALRGKHLFTVSKRTSSSCQLEELTLGATGIVARRVLLEPSDRILERVFVDSSSVYVTELDSGMHRLEVVTRAGTRREVALPMVGTIRSLSVSPYRPGAVFMMESWTRAPSWFSLASGGASVHELKVHETARERHDEIVVERRSVRSADGTLVPLTLLRAASTTAESPMTILNGYGAFGEALMPRFDSSRLAWLRRGGQTAFAHVRGGGELGPRWHEAGRGGNKMRGVDDFIACAEYLVRERLTTPRRLGVWGESAGGILIGGIMNRRPDLIGAAVARVGLMNLTRALENTALGPGTTEEYGDPTTPEGRRKLLELDAFESLRRGEKVPPVFLSVGKNDPRVPPWQSAKLAARRESRGSDAGDVLLSVNADGHGYGTTSTEWAKIKTLIYGFLLWKLGHPDFQPADSTGSTPAASAP